jgi:hypothetical protein
VPRDRYMPHGKTLVECFESGHSLFARDFSYLPRPRKIETCVLSDDLKKILNGFVPVKAKAVHKEAVHKEKEKDCMPNVDKLLKVLFQTSFKN